MSKNEISKWPSSHGGCEMARESFDSISCRIALFVDSTTTTTEFIIKIDVYAYSHFCLILKIDDLGKHIFLTCITSIIRTMVRFSGSRCH